MRAQRSERNTQKDSPSHHCLHIGAEKPKLKPQPVFGVQVQGLEVGALKKCKDEHFKLNFSTRGLYRISLPLAFNVSTPSSEPEP